MSVYVIVWRRCDYLSGEIKISAADRGACEGRDEEAQETVSADY